MIKYIGRAIAGAAAGMAAVAQPSMGVWGMGEDGRFGAGSQTPDPRLRHLADQGREQPKGPRGRHKGHMAAQVEWMGSWNCPTPFARCRPICRNETFSKNFRVAVLLSHSPPSPPPHAPPGSPSALSPNLRFIFLGSARVRASAGCGSWPSTFRRGRSSLSRAMINPPFIRRLIQMSVEANSCGHPPKVKWSA